MKIDKIQSIHGDNFISIHPEEEYYKVYFWLTTTKISDLKSITEFISNNVCYVSREHSNEKPSKGVYWTNSWIWYSPLVTNKNGQAERAYKILCTHFPFEKNDIPLPPIPEFLYNLYIKEHTI
jgi:hypothetical protein